MTRYFPLAAVFLFTAWLSEAAAADIPVREVILYKSGVGYFERAGTLRPGESGRLDFKASDMNDVLKSLTISGQNAPKVTGLRYDSSEPLNQKLADFPFKITAETSLALFLDQMKGAKAELKYGAEIITGTIVSGRVVKADDKQPEREQLVVLLDSGELRILDLAAAGSIRFADPKLQTQLRDYLSVVNQSRSTEKRSIYIDASDAKERQIDASYTIPAPVWKSSYRLIFTGKPEPTLEGWAIVDNTTGEDWTNVHLAVVSGRPVSFISNLYEPKYVARQTVELPENQAANPVIYSGAVTEAVNGPPVPAAPAFAKSQARLGGNLGGAGSGVAGGFLAGVGGAINGRVTDSLIALNVASGDVDELFEYSFSTPVSVKKDESIMLPFLQQDISARKLLIYSESYGEHPMNAAELNNSTAKTLDGG
ncbi:MAG: hypothetical protein JOZ32_00870, partial [Bryobacterales bacterium]|nr:hypothetical protein [Bryobacterales bacterium]